MSLPRLPIPPNRLLYISTMDLGRFELPTLRLSGIHSDPLSYKSKVFFIVYLYFFIPAARSRTTTLLRLHPSYDF